MSNLKDFFTLDDYVNIVFSVCKKKNESGGFFFDVLLAEGEDVVDRDTSMTLYTKWKYLDWDSKNNILNSSRIFDPIKSEVSYDPILYKDNMIKGCLVEWRSSDDDGDTYKKVDKDFVDSLPFDVVERLLHFYEKAICSEEESLGKV